MHQTDLLVNSPRMAGVYRCNECHMTFNAPHLLSKHKAKFCVGGTGDPDELLLRRGLRSADDSPRRISPDYDRPITDSELVRNKVRQLRDLKRQRQRDRDLNDLEERMLLDEIHDTEGQLHGTPPVRRSRNRLPLSKHDDIRELQIEYEKLREKESKTVVPKLPLSSRTEPRSPFSHNSNSSMSIHLEDEYKRYNPNQDQQLRNLAERHGQQMEYLNLRNKDLEKQRDEIRKQLEGLGKKPVKSGRDSTTELLRELQRQEESNRRMLEDLRAQLYGMGNQRVNVIEVEKPVQPQIVHAPPPPPPPQPPPPPPEPPKKIVIPVYHSNLVDEIIAVREAYIQNGGNDQILINQLRQMENDARELEEEMKRRKHEKPKDKPKDNHQQFKWLEDENERLHRELMLLQEQNALAARNRDRSDKEGKYRSHDRHHAVTPSKYTKRKHSIPDRFAKPKNGSRESRKAESHKTDALSVNEELMGDIEHDSDKVSTRSSHSEPHKKSGQKVHKERVAYYTVYHDLNGHFQVEKGPESTVIVDEPHGEQKSRNIPEKRPHKMPPLDLQSSSSPTRYPQSIQQQQTFYSGYENKKNRRSSYNNFSNQPSYPDWVNFPVVPNPSSSYNPQLTQSTNSGFPHTSPARYGDKHNIGGFHGIVDPNNYSFYQPAKPGKEPQQQNDKKVKAKSYKPSIKHELPRQQMEKHPDYEEKPEPNPMVYDYQQNDATRNIQEPTQEHPDRTKEQEVAITPGGTQVMLPSYAEANEQQLPSNQYGNQDEGEVEYTPNGSVIYEESDDDVSIHLPNENQQYTYPKSYAKY